MNEYKHSILSHTNILSLSNLYYFCIFITYFSMFFIVSMNNLSKTNEDNDKRNIWIGKKNTFSFFKLFDEHMGNEINSRNQL